MNAAIATAETVLHVPTPRRIRRRRGPLAEVSWWWQEAGRCLRTGDRVGAERCLDEASRINRRTLTDDELDLVDA